VDNGCVAAIRGICPDTPLYGRNADFCFFADCRIDICHVTEYNSFVIKTFADGYTRDLYETGKSRRFPPEIMRRALRKLEYIDLATGLQDLKVPPSNRLHELSGDRKGQFSISVNDQWRICFRFEDGDAFDVELTDYH
jgi:proteic killer suppression protein